MYISTLSQDTSFKDFSTSENFKRTVSTETIVFKWLNAVVLFFEYILGQLGKAIISLLFYILVPVVIMPVLHIALWFSARHIKKRVSKIIELLPFIEPRGLIEIHLVIEHHLKQLSELKITTEEFCNTLSYTTFHPFLKQVTKYHNYLSENEALLFKAAYPDYDVIHSEDELRVLAEAYKHIDLEDLD